MIETINYIINHGSKEHPVTNAEIRSQLKLNETTVRHHINKARTEGHPICSCDKGYYYSEDKTDILNTVQSLMHRTMAVDKAVNGMLSALRYGEGE